MPKIYTNAMTFDLDELKEKHLKGSVEFKYKDCTRCSGRGYKKQAPGEYGLSQCIYCNGTGKVIDGLKDK